MRGARGGAPRRARGRRATPPPATANDEAVAAAVAAFGGLDVLVNCVGVFDFYRGSGDLDADLLDEAFDEMFRVNVKSHLHAVKAALPALRASRRLVVLTESTSAYYPGRGGVLYVSSKFAVRGLVTALAHELAPDDPGQRRRPRRHAGHRPARAAAASGLRRPAPRRHARAGPRSSPPASRCRWRSSGADHAWSYVFLASERARGITGGVVHPDGGIGVKGHDRRPTEEDRHGRR